MLGFWLLIPIRPSVKFRQLKGGLPCGLVTYTLLARETLAQTLESTPEGMEAIYRGESLNYDWLWNGIRSDERLEKRIVQQEALEKERKSRGKTEKISEKKYGENSTPENPDFPSFGTREASLAEKLR